jgi:hypothetical protein
MAPVLALAVDGHCGQLDGSFGLWINTNHKRKQAALIMVEVFGCQLGQRAFRRTDAVNCAPPVERVLWLTSLSHLAQGEFNGIRICPG